MLIISITAAKKYRIQSAGLPGCPPCAPGRPDFMIGQGNIHSVSEGLNLSGDQITSISGVSPGYCAASAGTAFRMFRTFSSPSQSLKHDPVPEFRYMPPSGGGLRETTLTHQTFRQGVGIKAVPLLHLFMVVRRSHMALATSATSARIFRVRHSSFTQPPA